MGVQPTISVEYSNTSDAYGDYDAYVVYPISFKYGFMNDKPTMPHVATSGSMQFYLDNLDLLFTEASSDGDLAGKGTGGLVRILIDYDSDNLDTFSFYGRIDQWNVVPGLFDERVVEAIAYDYIHDLSAYNVDGLTPKLNSRPDTLLPLLTANLPYAPEVESYSSNGVTFLYAFHDLVDGTTKGMSAASKITGSAWGHLYSEGNTLYFKNNDDWISSGASIGTLDNRFMELEISKNRDLVYCPIFVTFNPAKIGDSDEVLTNNQTEIDIAAGDSKTIRLRYYDPANADVYVTVLDSNIVTPVDATDYIYSQSSSTDASSDLTVTFTNKGSAGEYAITNGGGGLVTFTTLQVRGKPIYTYEKMTYVSPSSDANTSSKPLDVNLKYMDSDVFAEDLMNFLHRTYATYPPDSVAKSISFMATADSDMMTMAMKGKIGATFTLVEDVNLVNEDYRITSVGWDIYAPQVIIVNWGVYPNRYFALRMTDSDSVYLADSNGAVFAYWR